MPTFKNLYKMPVNIYFGDLEPKTIFRYDEIHKHLFVGPDDYGRFNRTQFKEIKQSWADWCQSHLYDHNLGRWLAKDL